MTPILDLEERRDAKALLLGHIRLGTFSANHPQASEGFVFTSSDPARLKPLAADFGGEVAQYKPQGAGEETWRVVSHSDAFTAVLPFPDRERNLDQWRVLWQRSGLKRRCDGATCSLIHVDEETGEITEENQACICAETNNQLCDSETRLYLLLPQAGLGLWQLTTHSKFAASYLHAQLGFFEAVAPGRLNHLPVRVLYAPREIAYFDQKEGKRRTTKKRIVSLSIAGDAEHALRALALEPDRALIAAVSAALEDAGRELVGVRPSLALPEATADEPPASTVARASPDANARPDEAAGAEAPGEPGPSPPGSAGRPDAPDDEPASTELWGEAIAVDLSGRKALLRLNKGRAPTEKIRDATVITTGQLRALIKEAKA